MDMLLDLANSVSGPALSSILNRSEPVALLAVGARLFNGYCAAAPRLPNRGFWLSLCVKITLASHGMGKEF
jgi:hypothetical protein